jgi:hypothetical protein
MSRRPSSSETVAQGHSDALLSKDPVPHIAAQAAERVEGAEEANAPIGRLMRRPSRRRLRLFRGRRRFLWRLRGDRFTVTGQG